MLITHATNHCLYRCYIKSVPYVNLDNVINDKFVDILNDPSLLMKLSHTVYCIVFVCDKF